MHPAGPSSTVTVTSMKWFFAHNGFLSQDAYVKAMIRSAVANTALEGYFIYFDLKEEGDPPILDFVEDHGITVIRHKPGILEDLKRTKAKFEDYPYEIATGVWLRIDVPLICRDLGFSDEFVLYTDCDVLFLHDIARQADQPFFRPRFLSMAPEVHKTGWDRERNAGVMAMNVVTLLDDYPLFREFITTGDTLYYELFRRGLNDQAAYNTFYADRLSDLPLEYNWKPYWGFNEDARIVHYHGPKVEQARRMLNGETHRLRPIVLRLFNQNPEAYRKYIALFEEYAA